MRLYKTFRKARLVEGSYRWYIEYWATNPHTNKLERFRETYGINRMPDVKKRRDMARQYIEEINRRLPAGFPYEDVRNLVAQTPLMEAVTRAGQIKATTDRGQSVRSINSYVKIFGEWALAKGYGGQPAGKFDRAGAIEFLDWVLVDRGVGPQTYNNYINNMKALFSELVDRQYLDDNPFAKMKMKKVGGKQRRAFSDFEKEVVARYVAEHDAMLMLGIVLQYYCFIRPEEMRRLRIRDIDVQSSVIRLQGHQTKNRDEGTVTIPDAALQFIAMAELHRWPGHWLAFGKGVAPHPTKPCGERTLNMRHREQVLYVLKKKGKLQDVEGLSYYSWKDTGAQALVKAKVDIREIMRQMRHKNLSYTQRYLESLYEINQEIKELQNPIF